MVFTITIVRTHRKTVIGKIKMLLNILKKIIKLPYTICQMTISFLRFLFGVEISFSEMSGAEFENYTAAWLSAQGFTQVTITQGSNDYGIDILATNRDECYGIQCKCYTGKVGVSAVQQVVGGMSYYSCDRGVLITNSAFTRQALELAETNDIILVDGDDLRDKHFRLIDRTVPLGRLPRGLRFILSALLVLIGLGCITITFYAAFAAKPFYLLAIIPAVYAFWGGITIIHGLYDKTGSDGSKSKSSE